MVFNPPKGCNSGSYCSHNYKVRRYIAEVPCANLSRGGLVEGDDGKLHIMSLDCLRGISPEKVVY